MNAYELLHLFNRNSIGVEVHGDTIRLRAPRGFLTPERLDAVKQHKQELISILAGSNGGAIPRRADPRAPVPVSDAQRQLWFLAQLEPDNPFYNNPSAIELIGRLDVEALTEALTGVVRRHEALRTVFRVERGEPYQAVLPARPVPLPVIDLCGLSEVERLRRVQELTAADARAPFDLAAGPLLRSQLLRLAPDHHRFLLNVHHIVADGWSIGILVGEISERYTALVSGADAVLPDLPTQYPDYTLWQHRRMAAGERERQLAYWTDQLAGAPELLALPTDRPRPAVERFRGALHTVSVDAEVTRGLHAVGQAGEATLFMTLMAALSVLLWRYSGQHDVCVGTPFANRNHRDVEGLIGHFVNTIVIRNRLDPAQPFEALLRDVRRDVLAAHAHPDLPFQDLVQALNPQRDPSHSPLFQVMLVLQNLPQTGRGLPGLTMRPLHTTTGAARFDLSVEAAERGSGLTLTFEYNIDLFDATTIERMSAHFTRLLREVATNSGTSIGRLSLLDESERRRQLYEWNGAVRPPSEVDIVARFAEQAARRPQQPAVVHDGEALDYAALRRRAYRLAHALRARGVRPDDVVGLHVGRGFELPVGILGILAAGAAYLPLDPDLPPQRLDAMVRDAAPALVLSDAQHVPAGWLSLSEVERSGASDALPAVAVHPANLAYVIFTSGSTGRPKGVAVSRGGVMNLIDHWLGEMGALPGQPAALWSSVGFDVSVQEILLPLTTGGTLHPVPGELRADPDALMRWLREHRIAQAYLPPAFITWIDESPDECLAGLALRQLLVGVEPLPEMALHRIANALPGLRILNGYGPTETAVYSTAYPDPQGLSRQCPIGRPLTNVRVYLLDEHLEPVPVGVAGEVYIGGAGLARGYLGRAGLTAERFLPDPFVPGERVYRTGDLAHHLPDGAIVFVGRRDSQVKLRGFRIELGEIEAALLAEPDVHEAAALLESNPAGEPRLVAGVSRGGAEPRLRSEWRAILSHRLPGYMIPAEVVELPHLPQTANGKLDREALLRAARAAAPVQVNLASPRDHLELALYDIWRGLLLHPHIGIGDSFFDIGGTSISAIKLVHAIRAEFGVSLPVRDVMLYPTIEALGGRLRESAAPAEGPLSNLIEFRAGDGRDRVVCVHPAGGTAFCYLSLAKVLPESVGVYGIQSPGVNPGEKFLPTVEAMAEAYLGQIGPVSGGSLVLTGLSYGGLVAYEMGRRLAAAGHTGVSVLLLDTLGTDDPAHRAAIEPVDLAEFKGKLVKFNGMYPGIDDTQIEQYFHIYNHNRLTMRDYLAPPSPVRLVLLQATANRDEEFLSSVRQFWGRRALDGLVLHQVHCDHWEMLESDEVLTVGDLLRAELARVAA